MVQSAGRPDPVQPPPVEVTGARILRGVADRAAAQHQPGRRLRLAGQDLGQRRLAGPVATDESDLVTGRDLEGGALQQQVGTRPNLEIPRDQHEDLWFRTSARNPNRVVSRSAPYLVLGV